MYIYILSFLLLDGSGWVDTRSIYPSSSNQTVATPVITVDERQGQLKVEIA